MTARARFDLDLVFAGHPLRLSAEAGSGSFEGDVDHLDLDPVELIDELAAGLGAGQGLLPSDALAGSKVTYLAARYDLSQKVFGCRGECVAGSSANSPACDFLFLSAPAAAPPPGADASSPKPPVYLLGVSFRRAVGLESTPLFGERLRGVQLEQLAFMFVTGELDLSAAGAALPMPRPLPAEASAEVLDRPDGASAAGLPPRKYQAGLYVSIVLRSGEAVQEFLAQIPVPPAAPRSPGAARGPHATTAAAPTPLPGFTKWFSVGKSFGPLRVERVGIAWQNGELGLMLDAAIAVSALSLGLQGFMVSFKPAVLLRPSLDEVRIAVAGLNIAWQSGPLTIAGAFLREPPPPGPAASPVYSGAALIKTPATTLAAIGSFAMVGQDPSLLIFVALDLPLGGPPFFFVTGLAAGFGYNRDLVLPPAEAVPGFSLVRIAVAPGALAQPGDSVREAIAAALHVLGNDVPVRPGAYWVAAGVKFDSYELLHSLALLVVRFGQEFELALLGRTTLQLPAPELAFVSAELGLVASFKPSTGTLAVTGQLTENSYVLDRNARPTGGFAFNVWLGGSPYAGDFVLTIGGYHRAFAAPSWYPAVPRLGFRWQASAEMRLVGEAYFSLTPYAIMAGGRLEATFQSGNLSAWFRTYADFILGWRPFHYDAAAGASIGASYTLGEGRLAQTATVELSADIRLSGPPMHGQVTVNWWAISFTMAFGDEAPPEGQVIAWQDFRNYFLPAAPASAGAAGRDVCRPRAIAGLTGQTEQDGKVRWVVDPDSFTLATDTLIPATAFTTIGPDAARRPLQLGLAAGRAPDVGIRPMNVRALASEHRIEIRARAAGRALDLAGWHFVPQAGGVPAALWSTEGAGPLAPNVEFDRSVLPGRWLGLAGGRPPAQAVGQLGPVALDRLAAGQGSVLLPAGLPEFVVNTGRADAVTRARALPAPADAGQALAGAEAVEIKEARSALLAAAGALRVGSPAGPPAGRFSDGSLAVMAREPRDVYQSWPALGPLGTVGGAAMLPPPAPPAPAVPAPARPASLLRLAAAALEPEPPAPPAEKAPVEEPFEEGPVLLHGAVRYFQAASLPTLLILPRLSGLAAAGVLHLAGPEAAPLDAAALEGIVTPIEAPAGATDYKMQLRPGLAVLWDLPARSRGSQGSRRLLAPGGLDVRVTSFDRFDRLLEDRVLPGDGAVEHFLPEGSARLCVHALAPVAADPAGVVVAGWLGGSNLLQVSRDALLGEGVVVRGMAPHLVRRGPADFDFGPALAAEVAASNLVAQASGGSRPGWIATLVPGDAQSLVVLLRDLDGTPDAAPVAEVTAETYLPAATPAGPPAALEPTWRLPAGDRLALGYRLPAAAAAADSDPPLWQVLVRPQAGWVQDGLLAWRAPLPSDEAGLPTMLLPARGAALPRPAAPVTVTLAF